MQAPHDVAPGSDSHLDDRHTSGGLAHPGTESCQAMEFHQLSFQGLLLANDHKLIVQRIEPDASRPHFFDASRRLASDTSTKAML